MDNLEASSGAPPAGASQSAPHVQPAQQAQPGPVEVDDSAAMACYANFCRVTGTPEELIIDFGLNPQPFGMPTEPIVVSQRIVANLYTAKRLMHVLQMTVQRHEATFGALETDVQKRARRA
ncbi:MAG: DUF3467 domain-containing protein [Pirellulales bacterium]|nr:DUF3467 domain-containing protein [Pirellulales bacterium]